MNPLMNAIYIDLTKANAIYTIVTNGLSYNPCTTIATPSGWACLEVSHCSIISK